MTTTINFQNKNDFYLSREECLKKSRERKQTNARYRGFNQTHFTAGDEQQFQQYRDMTNSAVCRKYVSLENNIFSDYPFREWDKYTDLQANAVIDTFRYMFNKLKKGIFIKIVDNKLRVFLPFSKANFTNEWSEHIKVNKSKHGNMNNFFRKVSEMQGYRFNPRKINNNIDEWYGNNCLVRYERPIAEGDSNVGTVKNMLEELCAHRKIPDIELFMNRRDFPVLTRDGTEPYNNIWGSSNQPLVSHEYEKYAPILSMATSDRYADLAIPTWEDWTRVQNNEGKWFPKSCKVYPEAFDTKWDDKKPTAVFRGGTTGCGVTIDTNQRLKAAYISSVTAPDEDGVAYLDAGISNWNVRPRKLEDSKYLQTIDVKSMPFGLASRLSPSEQSEYKYIINIDGHVKAFRLSLELSMGSVILLVKSDWKIWYSSLLVPYEHYVPVSADLSDLVDMVKWCRNNDDKCRQIAKNAKTFFDTYLQKEGILDYMQKIFVDLKDETGMYFYNDKSPLDVMIDYEYANLDFSYPELKLSSLVVGEINLSMGRSYGMLQGLEWVIRKLIVEDDFEKFAVLERNLFKNNTGTVDRFNMSGFLLAVKSTNDHAKYKEHIHETYICTEQVNKLSKYIPNFAYIFGMYRKNGAYNVITEYISGGTLLDYINSNSFNFKEYLLIIIQLCLALQVAQNACGFVHNDLTPWNIVLQRFRQPQIIEYIIAHDKVVRIQTTVVPVIIDYGKSHVVNGHGSENMHHGYINMFKTSTIQDVITLMVTTIDKIMKKKIPPRDFMSLMYYANFLSETKYRQPKFKNAAELRLFTGRAKKYSELVDSDKYELERKEPIDLVRYIMKLESTYKFSRYVQALNTYTYNMNSGNARQVFEYILSDTVEKRLATYSNVFKRLRACDLPDPGNKFFVYFAAQSIDNNLRQVKNDMLIFMKKNNMGKDTAQKYMEEANNAIAMVARVYKDQLNDPTDASVTYTISDGFKTLVQAPYSDQTFLLPEVMLKIVNNLFELEDLTSYKEIIQLILFDNGVYALSDSDRKYYLENFKELLETKSVNMKNNSASYNSARYVSNRIYSTNAQNLNDMIADESGNCTMANKLLLLYKKF